MTLQRAVAVFAFFVALAALTVNIGRESGPELFGMLSAGILAGYAWTEFRRPTGAFQQLRRR